MHLQMRRQHGEHDDGTTDVQLHRRQDQQPAEPALGMQ
jgi:hypothetical protein